MHTVTPSPDRRVETVLLSQPLAALTRKLYFYRRLERVWLLINSNYPDATLTLRKAAAVAGTEKNHLNLLLGRRIGFTFRQLLTRYGSQMEVTPDARIQLRTGTAEDHFRPSVSHLFGSVADTFAEKAVAILLTGMGKDGARELKCLREKGSITIAQNLGSSVVHGMPGAAVKLGGAAHVLPPRKIVELLRELTNHSARAA